MIVDERLRAQWLNFKLTSKIKIHQSSIVNHFLFQAELAAGHPHGVEGRLEAGRLQHGLRRDATATVLLLELPVVLVDVTNTGGKEGDACGDVLLVAGFDGLVDVAGGDGDGTCDGSAGDHALEAGGVRATGR